MRQSPEYRDLSWVLARPRRPDSVPLTEMDEETLDQMARWMARACMDRIARDRVLEGERLALQQHLPPASPAPAA